MVRLFRAFDPTPMLDRPGGHLAVQERTGFWLEIVSWTANTPTSPGPNLRVAIAALGLCNCFAELHDLAGCLICIPSTASHATNGTLRRAVPQVHGLRA